MKETGISYLRFCPSLYDYVDEDRKFPFPENIQTYSYGAFSFCMPGARCVVPAEHGSSTNIEAADAKQIAKPVLISERR